MWILWTNGNSMELCFVCIVHEHVGGAIHRLRYVQAAAFILFYGSTMCGSNTERSLAMRAMRYRQKVIL